MIEMKSGSKRKIPIRHLWMMIFGFVVAGLAVMFGASSAQAHGSLDSPASRLWQCRFNYPMTNGTAGSSGNTMCQGAWQTTLSGPNNNMLYDWNADNMAAAGGQSESKIPDGKLCSGNNPEFSYIDTPSASWPTTNLTPGSDGLYHFHYTATAPHATSYYRVYLTNQGYNDTQALKWSDVTQVYQSAAAPAASEVNFAIALPARTGHQVLYIIWQRSDSQEAFYSCSDITVNAGSNPSPSATATSATPTPTPTKSTASPSPTATATATQTPTPTKSTATPTPTKSTASPTPTSASPTAGAAFSWVSTVTSDWGSGFCVSVDVSTSSPTAATWAIDMPYSGSITSFWNANYTKSGGKLHITGASWNPAISKSAGTNFGFCGTGTPPPATGSSGSGTQSPSATPTPTVTSASPTPSATSASPTASSTPTASSSPTATASPTQSGNGMATVGLVAPYVDMAQWPTPDLGAIANATGGKNYTLAFITSAGGCKPAWAGVIPLDGSAASDQLNAIDNGVAAVRAKGGDVIISLGGASGTELAASCTNQTALRNAYQQVIDHYQATRLDFDIEGAAVADQATNARRAQALAALQANAAAAGKTLQINLTLPVLPTGLDNNGLATFRTTVNGGVALTHVNVMAMDYGTARSDMGADAISAVKATGTQISSAFGNATGAALYAHIGVTPMIGQNDSAGEFFSLSNVSSLKQWAKNNGLGWVGWWSANRDKACSGGARVASATCSGDTAAQWSYAKAFLG